MPFRAQGYADGTDLALASGPTMQVCNRVLDIDRRAQTHIVAAREWHGANAHVTNVVHGYAGSAADAVGQVGDAVSSCTTYNLSTPGGMRTYTLASPVPLPSYSGISKSFAFCERESQGAQSSPFAQCWALLAQGNLLSVLKVYWNGQNTSDAFGELRKLTPVAADAVRAG